MSTTFLFFYFFQKNKKRLPELTAKNYIYIFFIMIQVKVSHGSA